MLFKFSSLILLTLSALFKFRPAPSRFCKFKLLGSVSSESTFSSKIFVKSSEAIPKGLLSELDVMYEDNGSEITC